jgi:hypothetical protein
MNLNREALTERFVVEARPFLVLAVLLFFSAICVAQTPDRDADSAFLKPAQQGGKWGYVNASGKFLISPQFESASDFAEGIAAVELDKLFGYIATDGHFVVRPKYFKAGQFKDGFAWVLTNKPVTPLGSGEYGVALFGQVTFVDHAGREVMRPFSAEHVSDFSEGLAAVRPGKIFGGCSEKVGYLNTRGEWAIKPEYDEAGDFSEGLAAVNRGGKCHMGGKWGYIDKDGKLAISFQYDFADQFKNGHACVEEIGGWKLIDMKGNGTKVDKDECLR